jgi:hypothetical protein
MAEKLGATGEFPEGKLNETDEGGLQFAVTDDGKLVRVHFGKPVAWMAMGADLADQFADALKEHAARIRKAAKPQ